MQGDIGPGQVVPGYGLVGIGGVFSPTGGVLDLGLGSIRVPTISVPQLRDLSRLVGDSVKVPVGLGGVSVQQPRVEVSRVDETPAVSQGVVDPPEIDRRDATQDKGIVFVKVNSWYEFHELKDKGVPVMHVPSGTVANDPAGGSLGAPVLMTKPTATVSAPLPQVAPKPPGSPVKTGGSMDLGDLLGTVTRGIIDVKLAEAGSRVTPVGYQPGPISVQPAFDIPFVDIVPDGACKKRRRRRRPIVTNAELGQLQGLTSTLKGDNLKVFLAKRVRS